MHKTSTILGFRVPVSGLILAVALVVVPTMGSLDRTAAAGVATSAPAAVSVEVAAAPVMEEVAEAATTSLYDAASWADVQGGVDPQVLALALRAAETAVANGDTQDPKTLTVIDFSLPSTSERMWVYDLHSRELLFKEVVSHGRNSGHNLTTTFSNQPESNKSSLGLFRTAEGYFGKHGYSLRLDGLEPGFNDRARERAIVIHGADYVNASTANAQGRLGRSLGCPAVRPAVATPLIDAVKEGGLVFAYYPDQAWLDESTYLN